MFSPGFVCWFVSLFMNKIAQNLWMDFQDMSEKVKRKKLFNFGSDPDHYLDLLDP